MRQLGEILLDLEIILDEMVDSHDLQYGDILGLTVSHLTIHRPDAQEEYEDGTTPVYFYGHKDEIKNLAKRLKILSK